MNLQITVPFKLFAAQFTPVCCTKSIGPPRRWSFFLLFIWLFLHLTHSSFMLLFIKLFPRKRYLPGGRNFFWEKLMTALNVVVKMVSSLVYHRTQRALPTCD